VEACFQEEVMEILGSFEEVEVEISHHCDWDYGMFVLDLVVDFSEVSDEVCVMYWSSVDAEIDVVRCCFLLVWEGVQFHNFGVGDAVGCYYFVVYTVLNVYGYIWLVGSFVVVDIKLGGVVVGDEGVRQEDEIGLVLELVDGLL
jgi:hypothetical protein